MPSKQFSFLEPGEVVQWEGRPVVWRAVLDFVGSVAFVVLIAFLFLLIDRSDPAAVPSDRFWVMTGLTLLVIASPLQAWWIFRRTVYVLTNRRAVVLQPWFAASRHIKSFPVPAWKLEVHRCQNGSGKIIFAQARKRRGIGFMYLADLSVVEPLVRALAAHANATKPPADSAEKP